MTSAQNNEDEVSGTNINPNDEPVQDVKEIQAANVSLEEKLMYSISTCFT